MRQYQRLFLIAGPTMRHSPAMERAIALADATGAALHIAVFIEDFDLMRLMSNSDQLRESCRQENLQWLTDEAELMRRKGINVTTEVALTRDPLQEILGHVAEMQPDMIIKDVHHESALKRVFVTPLDWQLLRECPTPIHLVSEVRCPLPRVIVAAVDPSHPEGQISGINDSVIQAANERHWLAPLLSINVTPLRATETSSFLPSNSITARRRPGDSIIVSWTLSRRVACCLFMRPSSRRQAYRQPTIRPQTSGSSTTSLRM